MANRDLHKLASSLVTRTLTRRLANGSLGLQKKPLLEWGLVSIFVALGGAFVMVALFQNSVSAFNGLTSSGLMTRVALNPDGKVWLENQVMLGIGFKTWQRLVLGTEMMLLERTNRGNPDARTKYFNLSFV